MPTLESLSRQLVDTVVRELNERLLDGNLGERVSAGGAPEHIRPQGDPQMMPSEGHLQAQGGTPQQTPALRDTANPPCAPLPRTLVNLSISIPLGPSILPLLPPDSLGERDEGAGGHSHPHGVPVPPSGAHVVPRCAARKYRLAKASMGQLPVPSPSCSLLPPSGPSGKAVLVGDPCRKERWAQGTAGTVHRAVAPEQRLPPFCDPAPGP